MTLGVGMRALLNSDILSYAESLGKLMALVDTNRASVYLGGHETRTGVVRCTLTFDFGVSLIAEDGPDSISAIKSAVNVAQVRNLL
jgi:hypothetical protein